jgi:hypothetical protein
VVAVSRLVVAAEVSVVAVDEAVVVGSEEGNTTDS